MNIVSEKRLHKFVIWSILSLILVYMPIARGCVNVRTASPFLFMTALLVFYWLWNARYIKGYIIEGTELDRPIGLFLALSVISCVVSIYKYDSLLALIRVFCYAGLFYVIVNNYTRSLRRFIIGLIICMGTGLSLFGLLQYFGLLGHNWWHPDEFLASTYVNHNHFSGYLELAIPIAIGLFLRYRSESVTLRLVSLVSIIIMGCAFVFAQSRAAWVCLGLSLFIMNLILVKRKILKPLSILVLVVIIFSVVLFAYQYDREIVFDRIGTISEFMDTDASVETRISIWTGALDMIFKNPVFGTGIGTFVWGFSRYRPAGLEARARYAHNDYLHMAAELGILAPVVMIWLLILVLRIGLKRMSAHAVMLGCGIGILSLAMHGLFDFNFHIPANMVLFVVACAVLVGEKRTKG